jgi:hypothetical protein
MPIENKKDVNSLNPPSLRTNLKKNEPLVEEVSCHPSFFCIAMHVFDLHNFM